MKANKGIIALVISMLLMAGSALADNNKIKIAPLTDNDFHDGGAPQKDKVELGRLLMFDKILSGNKNISCASCHHPLAGTGDGLSLPIGEGGLGLGVTRDTGSGTDAVHERVPRNAPHVWNEGAKEFTVMFHDGRLELDNAYPSGCKTPVGAGLPDNLENIVACQAMFPVASVTEMAGQAGENSIADAVVAGNIAGPGGVWDQLAMRLQEIPEYVDMFINSFDDVNKASDITYAHAANALSAFERVFWRADDSSFDRYLRGDKNAMSNNAKKGMKLFYRKNKHENSCADCHSGSYNSLRAMVQHHINTVKGINNYDWLQVKLPSRADLDALDFIVMNDPARVAEIAAHTELHGMSYSSKDVDRIIDFLNALTDPSSVDNRDDEPASVPSGLTLAE